MMALTLSTKAISSFSNYRRALLDYNRSLQSCRCTKRLQSSTPNKTETSLRPQPNRKKSSEVSTTRVTAEKAGQAAKTASYTGVILLGVGVTGALFYAVFNELFSSKSPNNVYTKAAKRCIADQRVQDLLGTPITSYGEETRRGRRQHVNHLLYEKDGVKHLRMKFYLAGTFHKGTVSLDMQETSSGSYEYRFLFVQVKDTRRSMVVLEDNRGKLDNSLTPPGDLLLVQ